MFEIRDRAASGRLGRLRTPHGSVETPTLLPVINPNLNELAPTQMRKLFGAQMVITNSYIIRKTEALRDRALADGVHALLDWDGPVMTDSGTFQSYVYGDVDVAPPEIIDFQKRIGVDVGTLLDVFTVPETRLEQACAEWDQTLERAKEAARDKGKMLLAATVQGGVHIDLRERAAGDLSTVNADVHPIGGVVPLMEQARYTELANVILAAKRGLPIGRPVHLFGAGHPVVFPLAAALGCDLFDSASYAKYAKADRMIFAWGTRSVNDLDELPCACAACSEYSSAAELRREPAGVRRRVLTHHNLAVSFQEIRRVRQAIREGSLWDLVEERAAQNPAMGAAVRHVLGAQHADQLERSEPISGGRAVRYTGPWTLGRPHVRRLWQRVLERWQPRTSSCVLLEPRTKPYSTAYRDHLLQLLDHDAVVDSPLGPVPLELDLVWPVAQSVFGGPLDDGAERAVAAYRESFFRKFDGCDVSPFEPEGVSAGAADEDAFDRVRVAAVARHQFGPTGASALLDGHVTFVRSPSNRRVRNVLVDTTHVASVRATDGLMSLRMEGALRLAAATGPDALRVVLHPEAVPHVAAGKNPMAVGVLAADKELRPGDECLLVSPEGDLVAIGRMHLAGWEVASVARGPVARCRGVHD